MGGIYLSLEPFKNGRFEIGHFQNNQTIIEPFMATNAFCIHYTL